MAHKILILDDDKQVRESLAICLEDEGFDVSQVASSEDALKFLKKKVADLVIVDLRLPGMDGSDFIQVAKKIWAELKFLVYTGSPEYQIPEEFDEEPNVSNSFFLKPLSNFDPMIAEIRRMLG